MKGRIFIVSLVASILTIVGSGMTLSYFTDTKKVENKFTLGQVKVELYVSRLARGDNTDAQIIADAATYQDWLNGVIAMPSQTYAKNTYVKNTGNVDAYVRIRYLMPATIWGNYGADHTVFNVIRNEAAISSGEWNAPSLVGSGDVYLTNDFGQRIRYNEYQMIRKVPLAPGAMSTQPALSSVKIVPQLKQEQIDEYISQNLLAKDGTFKIYVFADAIQTAGFNDAKSAFENMAPTYD